MIENISVCHVKYMSLESFKLPFYQKSKFFWIGFTEYCNSYENMYKQK